jgi:hypothetical protein
MTDKQRLNLLYKLKDNMLTQLSSKEELTEKEMSIATQLLKDNKIIDVQTETTESELLDNLVED